MREAIANGAGRETGTIDDRKRIATFVFDDMTATVEKLAAALRDAGLPAERKE